jgi:ABC-2 type transport system permease protein
MSWCVRREIWENRSIYIAPFVAAGVVILVILVAAMQAHVHTPTFTAAIAGGRNVSFWAPYILAGAPAIAIGLFVAVAYSLGALNGERRDRSILFWKSLPVSDATTVLAKASVPIILVPLISFAAATITQLAVFTIMRFIGPLSSARIMWGSTPIDAHTATGLFWSDLPIFYLTVAMLYGLVTAGLWFAPLYAWLLLVGGWARRMSFVWAVAPLFGLMIVERIVFGTDYWGAMLQDRLNGSLAIAFSELTARALPIMTPGRFLSDPGLWLGLAVAALLLGGAVLMRRYRQPS